jgi:hypothetical protein
MNRLKNLEMNKLFKELDYIQSDFEYTNEVITTSELDFLNDVTNFLKINPQLKELYDKKIQNRIDDLISKNQVSEELQILDNDNLIEGREIMENNIEEDITNDDVDQKIKSVYRSIVKLTHPDKVKDDKLNNYYLKATNLYDKKDIIGLYSICSEIGIIFDFSEINVVDIKDKIQLLKDRIKFMESTFTWKWFYSKDEDERMLLIFNFIKMQI